MRPASATAFAARRAFLYALDRASLARQYRSCAFLFCLEYMGVNVGGVELTFLAGLAGMGFGLLANRKFCISRIKEFMIVIIINIFHMH